MATRLDSSRLVPDSQIVDETRAGDLVEQDEIAAADVLVIHGDSFACLQST